MKKVAFAVSLMAVAFPQFVAAHPGHGEHGGYTIIHYFTEPIHVLASVGVLIATFSIVLFTERKRQHAKK